MSNETGIECLQRWAAEVERCKKAFDEADAAKDAASRTATMRLNELSEAQKSFDAAVKEFMKSNEEWTSHWDGKAKVRAA